MYNVKSMQACEFIAHDEILETLAYASANKNNASLIDSIIAKAKERKGLSHREAAVLLDCELDEKNQEIFALAEQIKKDFYGNRIVMFAPLYLSNYCINGCVYCPYHSVNKNITRKKLTQDEIRSEVIALQDMGHKRLALEAGEDPVNNPLDYILESCRRAHFNCVRVWGGGYYPSDAFYDLCDEKGLIVWQDLMYACNVYDVTDAFAENCRQETYDNVRRLRHHASLGLWCGNNEIESAWDHWGDFQKETPYLRADYIRLFEEVLPKAVQEADGETFYWHSSPSSGGCFDNPDDANRGDTHYWDVWHGQKPFTDYRKYFFRFCSEFGFQSFPCAKTVNSFTLEDDRNIFSRVMESHQKNDAANGKMLYYLSENLRYPKDLTHLLYASQVLQGMAIKYGVDHWRRNRGRCMGTLYWQINDDWPAPSWSSIDYFGRWKALHYMAQKFYAPHAVSMTLEDHRCHVYFSNESFETTEYSLTLSIRDLSGNVLETYETKGNSPAFSAIETAVVDICSWEDQKDDVFLEAVIHTKDQKVLKDVETLVPYKYLNLKNPVISTEAEETNDAFILHISSDCFAPFVALDFDDADVIFSDNFFHLTDKTVQDIIVKKEDILQGHFENAEDFRKRLQILSLGTSYSRS